MNNILASVQDWIDTAENILIKAVFPQAVLPLVFIQEFERDA